MKETIKERLKSPVVWAAVIAQICAVVSIFAPSQSETVKTVAVCIIEILTLFGILNNPCDKSGFQAVEYVFK